MKKLWIVLTVLCMLVCLSVPAMATDVPYMNSVLDDADLLTDAEESMLTDGCEMAKNYGCGVYIVTVADYKEYGGDPYTAARNIYLQYGMGVGDDADGIMLMLSMADRDFSLIAHGYLGNAVFPDYVKDQIIDDFLDDFADNDWVGGFTDYVNDCVYLLQTYEPPAEGEGYVGGYAQPTLLQRIGYLRAGHWAILIIVPCLVALVACLMMRSQLHTAQIATDADDYIPKRGVNLSVRQDTYLHTTTQVIHHEPANKAPGGSGGVGGGGGFGGGGGGGFSGRSGKF